MLPRSPEGTRTRKWILDSLFASAEWLGISTAIAAVAVPAGTFFPFAGANLPSGYLWCNGAEVSRTTYADLFTAIGTTWGVGDNSTTFNVPDFRDRVPIGKGDMGGVSAANRITNAVSGIDTTALAAAGGTQSKTLVQANLPNINLTAESNGAHTHTTAFANFGAGAGAGTSVDNTQAPADFSPTTSSNGAHTHNVPLGGSDTPLSIVQPGAVANYIIKT